MSVAEGLKQLFVFVGVLRENPPGVAAMPVRPGPPVTVTVSSSDGAVLHLARQNCEAATCTMPILPNWSGFSNTFFLWPTAPGQTTVTVTAPGFIGCNGTTVQVTVTP